MIIDMLEPYMKEHGLSNGEMERLCGLSNGCIGKWKAGKHIPSMRSLDCISRATGMDRGELLKSCFSVGG